MGHIHQNKTKLFFRKKIFMLHVCIPPVPLFSCNGCLW